MALPQLTDHETRVDLVWVRCYRCDSKFRILVERGCKKPPKLCGSCSKISPDGYLHGDLIDPNMFRNSAAKRRRKKKEEESAPPVTIYRPGSEGFNQIASLYSPPVADPLKSKSKRPHNYYFPDDDFMDLSQLPEDNEDELKTIKGD